MVLTIIFVALLVAADQAIKLWTITALAAQPGARQEFLPGLLNFRYVKNTGAAFSFFENGTVFFAVFTSVVLIAMTVLLIRVRKRNIRLLNAAITLILAGGIGNLIDRVARGFVVDMFEFDFISFPIFNFADVLICVGTGLLFIFILFFYEKYFPSKKKRTENKAAEKETVANDADRA